MTRGWRMYVGVACVYAVVGIYAVFGLGVALVPDVYCYARASCAWSSPLAAAGGLVGGVVGVKVFALVSVVVLGLSVAALGSGRRALLLLGLMVGLPHVPGLAAGPDAAGAALVVVAYSARARWVWLPAVGHLEAGLCLVAAKVARKIPRMILAGEGLVLAAGFAAMGALALVGYARFGAWPSEVQVRYLLPGAAVVATYGRKGVPA